MIGTILAGRYELTGLLVDGPIFVLYSARDRLQGREMSLRLVRPPFNAHGGFATALEEAVSKSSGIQHPNIERLFSVDQEDGEVYVVGELTRAPALADRVRKLAPFSAPVAVASALSICRGLDALHKSGLIHGDLSGENICLMADGEARLQMAGVWQAYSASPSAGAAVLPSMAPFLAPEVSKGAMPSARSDVYAVGILLFELVTGRKPYMAESPLATAFQHANEPTPSVRTLNPSVPMVLDEIIKKAMSKDPEERYSQAGEMLADLRMLQDALRFGRTLTWPLRPVSNAAQKAVPVTPKSNRVAPRMSAIQSDDQYEAQRRKGAEERDVPVWMQMALVFLGTIVISLFGVWFFLNVNRPRTVQIPNVRNMSISEARSTLEKLHLQARVAGRIANEQIEPDRVVAVAPEIGSRIRERGTVNLTLSAGSRQVEVPNLKGLTPDKARTVLGYENLLMDDQIGNSPSSEVPVGMIASQTPAPKSKVDRNTKVKVDLSSGEAPPATDGRTYNYTISVAAPKSPTKLRIEMIDTSGTRTVYDKPQAVGEPVRIVAESKDKVATFKIYYDDQLVQTVTQPVKEEGQ